VRAKESSEKIRRFRISKKDGGRIWGGPDLLVRERLGVTAGESTRVEKGHNWNRPGRERVI